MPEEADLILRAERAIEQTRRLREEVDRLRDMYRDAQAEIRAIRRKNSIEAREEAIRAVRRSQMRLVAFLVVWMLLDAYVAINVHEVYRDHCDSVHIATNDDRPQWCNWVFLFDDSGSSTMHH